MRRRMTAWGATLVLAVIGTQVAHALAYRLAAPDHAQREALMSATGHGYLSFAPLALAIGFAVLAATLAVEVTASIRRDAPGRCAWSFCTVAPVLFVVQEHLERLVHDGSFPYDTALDGTFQTGLALQLPFALAAYVLARVLLSAARRLGRLLGAPPRRRRVAVARVAVRALDVHIPRVAALALGYGGRGPPQPV